MPDFCLQLWRGDKYICAAPQKKVKGAKTRKSQKVAWKLQDIQEAKLDASMTPSQKMRKVLRLGIHYAVKVRWEHHPRWEAYYRREGIPIPPYEYVKVDLTNCHEVKPQVLRMNLREIRLQERAARRERVLEAEREKRAAAEAKAAQDKREKAREARRARESKMAEEKCQRRKQLAARRLAREQRYLDEFEDKYQEASQLVLGYEDE